MKFEKSCNFVWLLLVLGVAALPGCSDDEPGDESNPDVAADTYAVTSEGRLVFFERASGDIRRNTRVTGLQSGERILGVDFRPADAALYALSSSANLYTIDLASGEATLKSSLAADAGDTSDPFAELEGAVFGVNFNPVADRLRVVSDSGQNLRINVDTGATITDGTLSPASMAVHAVAYTNSFAGATSTALFAIDTAGAALTLIGGNPATGGACPDDATNPNCGNVTALGPLGVDGLSDVTGFDISADDAAVAFLAVTLGGASTSSLYVVDLESGAAAPPPGVANPTIGGGQALRDLTLAE